MIHYICNNNFNIGTIAILFEIVSVLEQSKHQIILTVYFTNNIQILNLSSH